MTEESAIITSYVKFTIQSLAWWTDPSDSNEQDFEARPLHPTLLNRTRSAWREWWVLRIKGDFR